MFQQNEVASSFSTNDVAAARAFYGDVLGFDVAEQYGVLNLTFPRGGKAWIYPKDDHEPAKFTVLNIVVDDIEQAVDGLAAKGVTFEHYDYDPIRTDEKGISREGAARWRGSRTRPATSSRWASSPASRDGHVTSSATGAVGRVPVSRRGGPRGASSGRSRSAARSCGPFSR